MINSTRSFRIGGLTFTLKGVLPTAPAQSLLAKFDAPESAAPDVVIYVQRVCSLRLPQEGKLIFTAFDLRVFETADEFTLCYRDTDEVEQREYAILRCPKKTPDELYLSVCESIYRFTEERFLSSVAMEYLLLLHNRVILHAACVEWNGCALLFSGNPGVGKSTQASLWMKYRGAKMRNGDKTLLRIDETGTFLAEGLPYAGSSDVCEQFSLPVAVIVLLSQGKENSLQCLTPLTAVKRLLSQIPVQQWSVCCLQSALNMASALSQHVPVLHLCCRPDESAVTCLAQYLEESVKQCQKEK